MSYVFAPVPNLLTSLRAILWQGSGERDIVALYTSFLGHAAIKKYADYLASHPLTTPQGDLERALRAAASYHLDVRLVAEEASRLSRNRAAKVRNPMETCFESSLILNLRR